MDTLRFNINSNVLSRISKTDPTPPKITTPVTLGPAAIAATTAATASVAEAAEKAKQKADFDALPQIDRDFIENRKDLDTYINEKKIVITFSNLVKKEKEVTRTLGSGLGELYTRLSSITIPTTTTATAGAGAGAGAGAAIWETISARNRSTTNSLYACITALSPSFRSIPELHIKYGLVEYIKMNVLSHLVLANEFDTFIKKDILARIKDSKQFLIEDDIVMFVYHCSANLFIIQEEKTVDSITRFRMRKYTDDPAQKYIILYESTISLSSSQVQYVFEVVRARQGSTIEFLFPINDIATEYNRQSKAVAFRAPCKFRINEYVVYEGRTWRIKDLRAMPSSSVCSKLILDDAGKDKEVEIAHVLTKTEATDLMTELIAHLQQFKANINSSKTQIEKAKTGFDEEFEVIFRAEYKKKIDLLNNSKNLLPYATNINTLEKSGIADLIKLQKKSKAILQTLFEIINEGIEKYELEAHLKDKLADDRKIEIDNFITEIRKFISQKKTYWDYVDKLFKDAVQTWIPTILDEPLKKVYTKLVDDYTDRVSRYEHTKNTYDNINKRLLRLLDTATKILTVGGRLDNVQANFTLLNVEITGIGLEFEAMTNKTGLVDPILPPSIHAKIVNATLQTDVQEWKRSVLESLEKIEASKLVIQKTRDSIEKKIADIIAFRSIINNPLDDGKSLLYRTLEEATTEPVADVTRLIQNTANPNLCAPDYTSFHIACKRGYVTCARIMIECPAVDGCTPADIHKVCIGNTPLVYAINQNYIDIVKLLIQKRVDVSRGFISATQQERPLHLACRLGKRMDIVRCIVDAKKDEVNSASIKEGKFFLPLGTAIKRRDEELIKYLVDNGADILLTHNKYPVYLQCFIASKPINNTSIEYVFKTREALLFERPAIGDSNNFSPVQFIAEHLDIYSPNIDYILDLCKDVKDSNGTFIINIPNIKYASSFVPLIFYIIDNGNEEEFTNKLLEIPQLDIVTIHADQTPLKLALTSRNQKITIIQRLLEKGALASIGSTIEGTTMFQIMGRSMSPLIWSIRQSTLDVQMALLNAMSENQVSQQIQGLTALDEAIDTPADLVLIQEILKKTMRITYTQILQTVQSNQKSVASLLLSHTSASTTIKMNKSQESIVTVILQHHRNLWNDIIELLVAREASVSIEDFICGLTLKDNELCRILWAGIDINNINKIVEDTSALEMAIKTENNEMIDNLLEKGAIVYPHILTEAIDRDNSELSLKLANKIDRTNSNRVFQTRTMTRYLLSKGSEWIPVVEVLIGIYTLKVADILYLIELEHPIFGVAFLEWEKISSNLSSEGIPFVTFAIAKQNPTILKTLVDSGIMITAEHLYTVLKNKELLYILIETSVADPTQNPIDSIIYGKPLLDHAVDNFVQDGSTTIGMIYAMLRKGAIVRLSLLKSIEDPILADALAKFINATEASKEEDVTTILSHMLQHDNTWTPVLKTLVEQGIPVSAANLIQVIHAEQKERFDLFLERVDVNQTTAGETPLLVATRKQNTAMITALLSKKAVVSSSCLCEAFDRQNLDIFGLFISFITLENLVVPVEGRSILSRLIAHSGWESQIRTVLEKGHPIGKEDILYLIDTKSPFLEILLEKLPEGNSLRSNANTMALAIDRVGNNGNVKNIEKVLKAGNIVTSVQLYHVLNDKKDNALLKYLVTKSSNATINQEVEGKSIVQRIIEDQPSWIDTIQIILEQGAFVSAALIKNTAQKEIVSLLLNFIDTTEVNKIEGGTVLSNILEKGWDDLVAVVLDRKATVSIENFIFMIQNAKQELFDQCITLVNVNSTIPGTSTTPLEVAIDKVSVPMVTALLDKKARVSYHNLTAALDTKEILTLLLGKNGTMDTVDGLPSSIFLVELVQSKPEWIDILDMLLERGTSIPELLLKEVKDETIAVRLARTIYSPTEVVSGLIPTKLGDLITYFLGKTPVWNKVIQIFVERGASISTSHLLTVIKDDNSELFTLFIENTDINKGVNGKTPLSMAIEHNRDGYIRSLVERGAIVKVSNLYTVLTRESDTMFNYLLDFIRVEELNEHVKSQTILTHMISNPVWKSMIQRVVEKGAKILHNNFETVIRSGDMELFSLFVGKVELNPAVGVRPLEMATQEKNYRMVEDLRVRQARVSTPLLLEVVNRHETPDIFQILIRTRLPTETFHTDRIEGVSVLEHTIRTKPSWGVSIRQLLDIGSSVTMNFLKERIPTEDGEKQIAVLMDYIVVREMDSTLIYSILENLCNIYTSSSNRDTIKNAWEEIIRGLLRKGIDLDPRCLVTAIQCGLLFELFLEYTTSDTINNIVLDTRPILEAIRLNKGDNIPELLKKGATIQCIDMMSSIGVVTDATYDILVKHISIEELNKTENGITVLYKILDVNPELSLIQKFVDKGGSIQEGDLIKALNINNTEIIAYLLEKMPTESFSIERRGIYAALTPESEDLFIHTLTSRKLTITVLDIQYTIHRRNIELFNELIPFLSTASSDLNTLLSPAVESDMLAFVQQIIEKFTMNPNDTLGIFQLAITKGDDVFDYLMKAGMDPAEIPTGSSLSDLKYTRLKQYYNIPSTILFTKEMMNTFLSLGSPPSWLEDVYRENSAKLRIFAGKSWTRDSGGVDRFSDRNIYNSKFNNPVGIVEANNTIYVADRTSSDIIDIDTDTGVVTTLGKVNNLLDIQTVEGLPHLLLRIDSPFMQYICPEHPDKFFAFHCIPSEEKGYDSCRILASISYTEEENTFMYIIWKNNDTAKSYIKCIQVDTVSGKKHTLTISNVFNEENDDLEGATSISILNKDTLLVSCLSDSTSDTTFVAINRNDGFLFGFIGGRKGSTAFTSTLSGIRIEKLQIGSGILYGSSRESLVRLDYNITSKTITRHSTIISVSTSGVPVVAITEFPLYDYDHMDTALRSIRGFTITKENDFLVCDSGTNVIHKLYYSPSATASPPSGGRYRTQRQRSKRSPRQTQKRHR